MSHLFKNTRKLALMFSALMLAITMTAGTLAVAANGLPDANKMEAETSAEDFILNELLDLSGGVNSGSVYDVSGMSFNAPAADGMKALYFVQGADFAKTSDKSGETLQKEAAAAAKSASDIGLNTVVIVTDGDLADKVGILANAFNEEGLYVYAVFDASKYTNSDADKLYGDVSQFAETPNLTGIIIDGFKAEAEKSSYAAYDRMGAAIGYNNYNNQDTANILKTAVKAVRDTSPDIQTGLFAKAEAKTFVEQGFVDFVMIKTYGLEKNENADELVKDWTKAAEFGCVTAYTIDEPGSKPASKPAAEIEVVPLSTPAAKPAVTQVSAANTNPVTEEADYSYETDDEAYSYEDDDEFYSDAVYDDIDEDTKLIKSVDPDGVVVADVDDEIEITVVAYKGANVTATINGELVYLYPTGESSGANYEVYSGVYITPESDDGDTQVLGGVSVYASYGSLEENYDSAYMKTESTSSGDRVPVQITTDQAKTYPANTKNNVPISTLYPLPKGALDYAIGKAFSYKDSKGVVHKYQVLESGMRVETQDIKKVENGPSGNKITGFEVSAGKDGYTYVTIKTDQRVTYKINYTGKAFEITFQNTTGVPSSATVKSNAMFSKAEFSGKNKLTLTLNTTNGFMGFKGYYDKSGNLIFRFNNPPSRIANAKIAIDPGHGGKDKGGATTNSKWTEDVLNYNIAKKLASELKARGATVNLMDNNGIEGPERAEKAEKWGADILISIHNNTSSNKSASGTEVYYHYPFSKQLAINSSLHVSKQQGIPNRNARQSYYHVTLSSQMASVLVECGFMTNKSDYAKLMKSKNQTQIAVGIADAIEGAIKSAKTGTASTGSSNKNPATGAEDESSSESSDSDSDGLTISPTSRTVGVGSTVQLKADSDIGADITWKSSKTSVAKVDSDGLVTAVAAGTATITATADTDSGTKSVKCTITVKEGLDPVTATTADTGIALSKAGKVRIYDDYLSIYPGNSARVEILSQNDQVVKNGDFKWTSSKTSVARVDSKGVVTAKSTGTCTVTATGGGYTLTCDINVSRDKVAVTGLKFEESAITVVRGSSKMIKTTISPTKATDKTITWTSSNDKIAYVDSAGVVTGKNTGSCTITGKTKSGGYKATCTVEVVRDAVAIDDISLRYETLEMWVGDTDYLKAIIYPSNVTSASLVWTSSRQAVATVDNQGNIEAIKKGTTTIRVSSAKDKDIYAECVLTVIE